MLKKLGPVVLALVVMVALAACGGGGGGNSGGLSAEEQAFADQLVTGLTSDTSPDNVMAGETQARCAAEGIVGAFGLERSQALLGASVDINDLAAIGANMTDAEKQTFANVVVGCVDLGTVMAAGLAEGAGDYITEEDAACVAGQISDDAQKQMLVAGLSGGEPDTAAVMSAVAACLDMREITRQQLIEMGTPESVANCIADGLSDDFFNGALQAVVSGEAFNPVADPVFLSVFNSCTAGG